MDRFSSLREKRSSVVGLPNPFSSQKLSHLSSQTNILDGLDAVQSRRDKRRLSRKNAKKKTREEEEEDKRFVTAVNHILVLFPKDKVSVASSSLWARIFRERMESSHSVTTEKQMAHYREIFNEWLDIVPSTEANGANRKLATSFLQYDVSHTLDPDNALIGMIPNERTLQAVMERKEEPAKKIPLQTGDLVIIRRHGSQYLFARVKLPPAGAARLTVHIDPHEEDNEQVLESEVFRLDANTRENMSSVKGMERLVLSPAEDFFTSLNNEIRTKSNIFLQEQGINVPLLRKFSKNEVTILDFEQLRLVREQLSRLLENIEQTDFFRSIQSFAQERVELFLKDLNHDLLFPPTRLRVLESLRSTRYAALAKVDIQKFIAVCDSGLDLMTLEKRNLLNGTIKNELTEWWLRLIRDHVERFLTDQGYDHNAVPYNYIEQAPSSVAVVRKNLAVLQNILGNLSDKNTPVHKLINEMKERITPKIDEFFEKAQFLICEHLDMDPRKPFVIAAAKRALLQQQIKDPNLAEAIHNLTMDLEYLAEMKHLEENPMSEGGLKLGVVPISGMIVGYFYRYENELLTVLDVWGHLGGGTSKPAPLKKQDSSSPIEQALEIVARSRRNSLADPSKPASLTCTSEYLGDQIALIRMASMDENVRRELMQEVKEERIRQVKEEDDYSEAADSDALIAEFGELQLRQLRILRAFQERERVGYDRVRQLQAEVARLQLHITDGASASKVANGSSRVRLDVGGRRYATSVENLTRDPESLLAKLVVQYAAPDAEIFIDRDGTHFGQILNFLRDGEIILTDPDAKSQLLKEARHYHLARLVTYLETGERVPARASAVGESAGVLTTSTAAVRPLTDSHSNPVRALASGASLSRSSSGSLTNSSRSATPTTGPLSRSNLVQASPETAPASRPADVGKRDANTPARTIPSPKAQHPAPPTVAATTAPYDAPPSVSPPPIPHVTTAPAAAAAPTAVSASTSASSLSGPSDWYNFFVAAGVPEETAHTYEAAFLEKGMTFAQVGTITPQLLKDYGVKMGHSMKVMKAKSMLK